MPKSRKHTADTLTAALPIAEPSGDQSQALRPRLVDLYDALTLEITRVNALAGQIEQRLDELSDGCWHAEDELFALSVIARQIIERNTVVGAKADELLRAA